MELYRVKVQDTDMPNGLDPYTPGEPIYECLECGNRSVDGTGDACPDCGGTVKNIAVPRE